MARIVVGRSGVLTGFLAAFILVPVPSAVAVAPDDAWWFKAMKVGRAHAAGWTGEGVKIAVIDGPIDASVPELRGANLRLGKSITGRKTRSYPRFGSTNHGTAMTVLIAGQGNGGVTGIAPDAEVTYYDSDDNPRDKSVGPLDFGPLIDQAVADGADIISISMTSTAQGVIEAAERAVAANVVVVAGGGPAGTKAVSDPAAVDGVVGVGAVDRNVEAWDEQPGVTPAGGANLTTAAPGVEVEAGLMTKEITGAQWVPSFRRTGTSPATAIAAGALALVMEKYPDATGNQIIQHLIHNPGRADGKPFYDFTRDSGFGVLSLSNLLRTDPAGWPDENPLLNGKNEAEEDYPLSIYKDPKERAAEEAAKAKEAEQAKKDKAAAASKRDTEDGSGAVPWVAGGVGLVAAVGVGGYLLVRRRGAVA